MGKFESPTAYTGQKATEKRWGSIRIATQAEASAGSAQDLAVSPARLDAAVDALIEPASETVAGKIEIATDVEALALTATNKAIVPSNLAALNATTTQEGLGELATDAEAIAKTVSTNKFLVPSNLAAEGFLQFADVTLTSAEVKALAATQIELVAAQGAGSVITFISASFKLDYGGTNVFTEAGDNLAIKYTDASGVAVSQTIETTAFITATADTYTSVQPVIDAIVASAAAENQALVLDNIGSEIAGNAANDNTLVVRVYYVVQSI